MINEENKIKVKVIGTTVKVSIPSWYGYKSIEASKSMSKEERQPLDNWVDKFNKSPTIVFYKSIVEILEVTPMKIVKPKSKAKPKAKPKATAKTKKGEKKAVEEKEKSADDPNPQIKIKIMGRIIYATIPAYKGNKSRKIKSVGRSKEERESSKFDMFVERFNKKPSITSYNKIITFLEKDKEEVKKSVAKSKKRHSRKLSKKETKQIKVIAKSLFNGSLTVVEDAGTGLLYLKEFKSKILMPRLLSDRIKEYMGHKRDIKRLVNFWSWCLLNPSEPARDKFFDYLSQHKNLIITEYGMVVTYRRVKVKEKSVSKSAYPDWITKAVALAKLKKVGLSTHFIASIEDQSLEDSKGEFIVERSKFIHYKDVVDNYEKGKEYGLGDIDISKIDPYTPVLEGLSIKELFKRYEEQNEIFQTVYTDNHSGKFRIYIGQEVRMPRKECDPNINEACSTGLHTGSPDFVRGGRMFGEEIIACLINPMDVVSVPQYDTGKMRSCAYFPAMVIDQDILNKLDKIHLDEWDDLYGKYQEERLSSILSGDTKDIDQLEETFVERVKEELDIKSLKTLIKNRVVYEK